MRFALGMDNREIARTLGRSEGATKVLIHRAIKQLEQELGARRGRRMNAMSAAAGRQDDGPGPRSCGCSSRRSRRSSRPPSFVDQLEGRLADVEAAAIEALEELSDWELDAMRDPRNWVRPVAALAVGTAAGTALVVLGIAAQPPPARGLRGLAEQAAAAGGAVLLRAALIR